MQLNLQVINLWTGPGGGKSTTAAGLFNLMKGLDLSVELVTEYAKDLTYEKNYGSLRNQLLILGEQDNRLRRLEGNVEWAITDSPLPLGLAYMTPEYEDWLPAAIEGAYHRYENYDFLIRRAKPYRSYGRNQTEHEALALDLSIRHLFKTFTGGPSADPEMMSWEVTGDSYAPFFILEAIGVPLPAIPGVQAVA